MTLPWPWASARVLLWTLALGLVVAVLFLHVLDRGLSQQDAAAADAARTFLRSSKPYHRLLDSLQASAARGRARSDAHAARGQAHALRADTTRDRRARLPAAPDTCWRWTASLGLEVELLRAARTEDTLALREAHRAASDQLGATQLASARADTAEGHVARLEQALRKREPRLQLQLAGTTAIEDLRALELSVEAQLRVHGGWWLVVAREQPLLPGARATTRAGLVRELRW